MDKDRIKYTHFCLFIGLFVYNLKKIKHQEEGHYAGLTGDLSTNYLTYVHSTWNSSPGLTHTDFHFTFVSYICAQFVCLPQLEDIYRIPKTRAVLETRVIYIKLIYFFLWKSNSLPQNKIWFLYTQIVRALRLL